MTTDANLHTRLSQAINEILAPLTDAVDANSKTTDIDAPAPSLFGQCLELCQQHNKSTQEPLRIIHNFGLPSGSILIPSLATLANTQVLINIHPNKQTKNSIKNQIITVRSLQQEAKTDQADEPQINAFIDELKHTQYESNLIGQRLLLCNNHCLQQVTAKQANELQELLKQQFEIKELIVVVNPVESYPAYCAEMEQGLELLSFEEYCHFICSFLQANSELTFIRYEELYKTPKKTLRSISQILGLGFNEELISMRGMFDIPSKLRRKLAYVDMQSSPTYKTLCELVGCEPTLEYYQSAITTDLMGVVKNKKTDKSKPLQIIVLGMHRSGTSCVTNLLSKMGAYFGESSSSTGANKENPKGFYERRDMRNICDGLLFSQDADWWKLADFDLSKLDQKILTKYRNDFKVILSELNQHDCWVIKEPRLCILLPVLIDLLDNPLIIHIYRNPVEVSMSLNKRNQFPEVFNLALWEYYNFSALKAAEKVPKIQISYNSLIKNKQIIIRAISKAINNYSQRDILSLNNIDIEEIVDDSLYRNKKNSNEHLDVLNGTQLQLYEKFEQGTVFKEGDVVGQISDTCIDELKIYEQIKKS